MKLCPHKLETFQRAFRGCVAIIENVILAKVFDIKWHQGLFWSIPCGLNVLLWYSGSILDHFWQILSEKNKKCQHQIGVINGINLKLAATYDTNLWWCLLDINNGLELEISVVKRHHKMFLLAFHEVFLEQLREKNKHLLDMSSLEML